MCAKQLFINSTLTEDQREGFQYSHRICRHFCCVLAITFKVDLEFWVDVKCII